jgi:hypothetical protein
LPGEPVRVGNLMRTLFSTRHPAKGGTLPTDKAVDPSRETDPLALLYHRLAWKSSVNGGQV